MILARNKTFAMFWAAMIAAAAWATSAAATETASVGTPEDEEAIHQLIVSYQEAWNKKDAVALGNLFSEDADFNSIYGQNLHGRTVIAEKHGNLFKGPQRESVQSRARSDVKIRFVKADVAAVDSISEITGVLLDPEGTRKNSLKRLLTSMVLVKNAGRWEIEVFHNMILPSFPMPPSAAE
jgi:uncharacterized protein (TIGR02246 family)